MLFRLLAFRLYFLGEGYGVGVGSFRVGSIFRRLDGRFLGDALDFCLGFRRGYCWVWDLEFFSFFRVFVVWYFFRDRWCV